MREENSDPPGKGNMRKFYLWRDYLLTKKQLKTILSKKEWEVYWNGKIERRRIR